MSTKEYVGKCLSSLFEDDECCLICERPVRSVASLWGLRSDVICSSCRANLDGGIGKQKVVLPMMSQDNRKAKQENMEIIETIETIFHVTYCYQYTEALGDYFFRYKGVGDVRLAEMFLFPYVKQLKKRFSNCMLVRMPSWHEDDDMRGFNHVHETFSYLGLPIVCPFVKKKNEKQSEKHRLERSKVASVIGLDSSFDQRLFGTKQLVLVDDVMTTGNTLRVGAELLGMKEVEVLVVALHWRLSKKDDEK